MLGHVLLEMFNVNRMIYLPLLLKLTLKKNLDTFNGLLAISNI